ncbi:MAG TPA: helix-turn-helix transcriptional regulator [Streptosporangiaceae bacterium]|jgi:transcriptional regulator with XRE-family HTH domain|nr:helix-turn-helix transcriptional regulator [Streptosporangiaceae bacterium]
MTGEHSPTVRRRRLASELRALREAARLTCEEVAEHLECSASKISRVETGRVSVSPRDVRDMLALYGVDPQQLDSLVQLARESRQKGWWHAYSDTMQPRFATYIGLEDAAAEIRTYELNLIPGLLQTEDYARTVINAGNLTGTQEDVERRVALRMARQPMLLSGSNPPQFWAVLDEGVLHRTVGGTGLMHLQLDHLLEIADMPNVAVQVIPFTAGAHPGMGKPFVILSFPERADTDVVYLEDFTSTLYLEDVDEIDRYNVLFNHLRATALSFEESAALITSVAKGL